MFLDYSCLLAAFHREKLLLVLICAEITELLVGPITTRSQRQIISLVLVEVPETRHVRGFVCGRPE